MNLFILSFSPQECAEMMMDKHIVKIILEAVQMLCSAKILLDTTAESNPILYKMAHKNHPVTKWVRESYANYEWTLDLVDAMHEEWKYRYDHPPEKEHKSYAVAKYLRENPPPLEAFEKTGLTEFALAMPDKYKIQGNPIESYKYYYKSKREFASWKKRKTPSWFNRKTLIVIDE
jgi:hypothetical protein